jgi:hypothetical protein
MQTSSARAEALAEKLKTDGDRTVAAFRLLNENDWATPCHGDGDAQWTVRNVLEHFIIAEREFLRMFGEIAARTGGGAPVGFDINRFNNAQKGLLDKLSKEELMTDFESVRAQLVTFTRTLNDAQLDTVGRHPALGISTLEAMLRLVALHNASHIRDMRKILGPR